MNIQFKGDTYAEVSKSRLSESVRKIFILAEIYNVFSSQSLIRSSAKDKLRLGSNQCASISLLIHLEHHIARLKQAISKHIFRNFPP